MQTETFQMKLPLPLWYQYHIIYLYRSSCNSWPYHQNLVWIRN